MSTIEPNDKDGKLVGYARVSTPEQRLDLQFDALKKAGVEEGNIFFDKMSGASKRRPGLTRMLTFTDPGDTVIVWRLDRLARSTKDLISRMEMFQERGIKFRSLTENIDTTTASGSLIFHMLAALAEFERYITRERISAGMKSAKERGSKVGAQPKLFGRAAEYAQERREQGATAPQIVRELNQKFRVKVTPRTIYHRTGRNG